MTQILPTSATAAFAKAATSEATTTSSTVSSDFETFIKMLTVQMENQDPLNPIDSSEYAAQLAAFSSVEQQVLTNDLLTALAAQLNTSGLAQLSNWVGMDARSSAGIAFDGAPQTLYPMPASLADEAYLVAYDSSGNEVHRSEIGLDGAPVEWAGVLDGGTPIENGTYYFEVENYANGELLGSTPAENYQTVSEAQMVEGQIVLILESGQPIFPENVVALSNGGGS
ncbi:hypothetical protein KO498_05260 [Lentibacter algarum]|uniref:flagellar hook capping FlgD N-terminal domain-containing protein n=1 Tax=Lentibacter algarum TaxID=576131 RepID=UPI001C078F22|nr:flagellar hook capping FlgD N-terminal domain-containing protein [Lentibacter algarum]MBU2981215.1 hypothetical protein [Lentibacter algarum]